MDKATKQYRQYIFKVNHKLARKPTKQGQPQDKGNMKVKGMLRAASKVHLPLLSPSHMGANATAKHRTKQISWPDICSAYS